jgi:cytochrome c oxidase subunit 4
MAEQEGQGSVGHAAGAAQPGHHRAGAHPGQGGHEGEGGHATVGFYWMIGAVLGIITAVEVAVFYIPALAAVLVPVLLVLSAAKFTLVVMFFMHLRFDSPVLTALFMAGLVLAAFMVSGLIILYHFLPRLQS